MIGEDGDGMLGALKILLPFFKRHDNGQEFSVVDVIVLLSRSEGMGEVSAGEAISISVGLKKYCSHGDQGHVCHD